MFKNANTLLNNAGKRPRILERVEVLTYLIASPQTKHLS